jgi:hypothetical protein
MSLPSSAPQLKHLLIVIAAALVAACGESESEPTGSAQAPDTAAPAVTVTSPSPNSPYTASAAAISLAGTATDNVGVTAVSWTDDRGGSGTAGGTSNWSVSLTVAPGTTNITITAVDAAGNRGSATYVVNYVADTTAPTISAREPAANATGVATNATVRVTFSEALNPSTVNTSTISVRPSTAGSAAVAGSVALAANVATFTPSAPLAAGTSYTVQVSTGVRDAAGNALSAASTWSFTTAAATTTNRAPTISGTPPNSVMVGSPYSFTPTAADPDGDTLTFSLTGTLPSSLTFSTANGRISGTPVAADVGTYSNLRITVSDGRGGTASLAAFSVAVVQTANGSVTLSWTAPTQNADGTPLTDLAGYRILYGNTSGGPYNRTATVSNPGVTSYVINQLSPGTYYFVARALDNSGNESTNSNEASKTITN